MEGAKIYVLQDSSWQKATVVAAHGKGKYRVSLDPWEGPKGQNTAKSAYSKSTVEVEAEPDGGLLQQNSNMPEEGFEDMTTLDHLHEAALLHNLRVRFFAGTCPYTYTADIVIAINPYQWIGQLYTEEKRKQYLALDKSKLAPHVYATSTAAYSDLQERKVDQSVLVSGESGAGKTETVKILMKHLASIASSDDTSHINRIVETNPLLESFGNAQTVRNDNSSRFGKFIELQLNSSCKLVGSKCRTYLLEKSRVVFQDAGERNYHIFYQMLATDEDQRAKFGLGGESRNRDTMRYTMMGSSQINKIEGKNDGEMFAETKSRLQNMIDVQGDTLDNLLHALASVLLLGQLEFDGKANEDAAAKLTEKACPEAASLASALQVEVSALENALTKTTLKMRSERVVKSLSPEAAAEARDALAKELYSRLFDWIVARICAATSAVGNVDKHFIGLLDIFGFESFAINRFEQLCINYANERLQQQFTTDVFKAVQQEYSDEGIPWDKIEFQDNSHVLDLIQENTGVIAMLNDECKAPAGNEKKFVSKLQAVLSEKAAFSTPRTGKQKEVQFCVQHYADKVTYTATGWLERNRDTISDDVVLLMRKSGNSLVASIFAERDGSTASSTKTTVVTKFKQSLNQLMETIRTTTTQYVRCIKPNKVKSPAAFENEMVLEQLRCAGVVEAIRISRAGFPARMPLAEFTKRFLVLARSRSGKGFIGKSASPVGSASKQAALAAISAIAQGVDRATASRKLITALVPGEESRYEIGRTRAYFKSGFLEKLEEERSLLEQDAATDIARRVLGRRARRKWKRQRHQFVMLQAQWRMHCKRAAFLKERASSIRCQACWRGFAARRRAHALRRVRCAVRLQACWHRHIEMRAFKHKKTAAIKLQSVARRVQARRAYLINLSDAKEQAKLENQVRILQERLKAHEKAAKMQGTDTDVLDALHTLTEENKKIREDLERVRKENAELRRENRELRERESMKKDQLDFLRTNHNHGSRSRSSTPRPKGRGGKDRHQHHEATIPEKAQVKAPPVLYLYEPQSHFWVNLPCADIPLQQSGVEVHIKLGQKLFLVDESKRLIWKEACEGYRHTMEFVLERRIERQSGTRSSFLGGSNGETPDADIIMGLGSQGFLGVSFALRSSSTGQYARVENSMINALRSKGNRVCMDAEAAEATVFTFVPQEGSQQAESVQSYHFALRLLSENKALYADPGGYVFMKPMADEELHMVDDSMAVSMEFLLPATSYEITINDGPIGLSVGPEFPLKVIAFKDTPEGTVGAGESNGRVHKGDLITSANGQSFEGCTRQEALKLINENRPLTLGFTAAHENPNTLHSTGT